MELGRTEALGGEDAMEPSPAAGRLWRGRAPGKVPDVAPRPSAPAPEVGASLTSCYKCTRPSTLKLRRQEDFVINRDK